MTTSVIMRRSSPTTNVTVEIREKKQQKKKQTLCNQETSKNGLKTKLNEQRATKQKHTPTHAVGIFKPLNGPVHGYHNTSVAHVTMTLVIYRTIKIDHYHYQRNENLRNRSMKKDKKLGCYRNQLYKPPPQISAVTSL